MNLIIAMLNLLSGLLLVWPAIKLTGDLRFIKGIEGDLEGHTAGTSNMGDDSVDVLDKVLKAIKTRNQRWNKRDARLLYTGLGLFITSSFLQILVALMPADT